jgi:hypothetical protein
MINNVLKNIKIQRALQEAEVNKKVARKIKMKGSKLSPGSGIGVFTNAEALEGNTGVKITYKVFDAKGTCKELTQIYKWGSFTGEKLEKIWETMNMDNETQNINDLIGEIAEVEIFYNKEFTNIDILAPMEYEVDEEDDDVEDDMEDEDYDYDEVNQYEEIEEDFDEEL